MLAVMLVACGNPTSTSNPTATGSPSGGPQGAGPREARSADGGPASTSKIVRETTPAERFAKDDAGCKAGDKTACRALADRYAGAGLLAGCGVPRARTGDGPRLKRTSEDTDPDRVAFLQTMGRACALGDAEACTIAQIAPRTYAKNVNWVRRSGLRIDPQKLGSWRFAGGRNAEHAKKLKLRHDRCMTDVENWECPVPDSVLFKREKAPGDGKLTEGLRTLAETVCAETRDCDDVYMMLDREGYSPEELAPVRASFAKTLIDACVQGDCTCGEATKYLPADDERVGDLAQLGCDNGEAEGCYVLGRRLERGEGRPADPIAARTFYDAACPPIRVRETDGQTLGDYAPHACDRYAEIFAGGPYPGKDRPRGKYYADFACRNPGEELDHAPCVRLGMLWATKRTSTGKNGTEARWAAWANTDPLAVDHECTRKSVQKECAELKEALKFVK